MFLWEEIAKIQVEIDKAEKEYENILEEESEDIDEDLNNWVTHEEPSLNEIMRADEKKRLKKLMKEIQKEK